MKKSAIEEHLDAKIWCDQELRPAGEYSAIFFAR